MEYVVGSLALENNVAANQIGEFINGALKNLVGQIGYKQPTVGVRDKADVPTFIIISPKFGIVLIDVIDEKLANIDDSGEFFHYDNHVNAYSRDIVVDNFFQEVENRLKKESKIYDRKSRQLKVNISRAIVFYHNTHAELNGMPAINDFLSEVIAVDNVNDAIIEFLNRNQQSPELPIEILDVCVAALEGTAVYDWSKKAPPVTSPVTKDDFIRISMNTTFKLDQTQRRIAMQIPDGPQRIRGLAGTGKTVILSLKAALTHKDFPSFKILFLFNTQSMYREIRKKISEYYIPEAKQNPNWDKLEVLHAWGGRTQPGLYSQVCSDYGYRAETYSDVRGATDALGDIYGRLLLNHRHNIIPKYDLILIDEAQDFSSPIFEMCYLLCKDPKRIVWAYDEFQTMTDLRMPAPEDLFGKRPDGTPNISSDSLEGTYPGGIEKDFILPNSYRNPRISLVAAHGLALGLRRPEGIIDMLDTKRDWEALGYEVQRPEAKASFSAGDDIVLERPEKNSKNMLESLIRNAGQDDKSLVEFSEFASRGEEIEKIALKISGLVVDDGVSPDEIIVVSLAVKTCKRDFSMLRSRLLELGIESIMPGFIESPSQFKESGAVTLSTPFRAKGNEANIVFVMGVEVVPGDATFRMRNALFVGMTRSRGWTYLSGLNIGAVNLKAELDSLMERYPTLEFTYPPEEELRRRRIILNKDDGDISRKQTLISEMMSTDEELLIEMLRSNPELMKKIASAKD